MSNDSTLSHSKLRQDTAVLLMEWGLSSDKLTMAPSQIERRKYAESYQLIAKLVGLPYEEVTSHFEDKHAEILLKLHGPHGYALCKAMLARLEA